MSEHYQDISQFEPKTGPAKRRSWSGSKPFDTLIVFLKENIEKNDLKQKSADDDKSINKYTACKEFNLNIVPDPGNSLLEVRIVYILPVFLIIPKQDYYIHACLYSGYIIRKGPYLKWF